MSTTSTNPVTAYAAAMQGQMMDTWSGVAGLYRDAVEKHAQQLLLSSTHIVQEHTLRAFASAMHACAEALAKNAVAVQQQSLQRYAEANRRAMELMGSAWMGAWLPNGRA